MIKKSNLNKYQNFLEKKAIPVSTLTLFLQASFPFHFMASWYKIDIFSKTYLVPVKSIIAFFFCCFFSVNNAGFAQKPKLMLPIGHTNKIYSAQFSPDGKKIVTASKDKTAKIWDVATGYLLADLKTHLDPVIFAKFSPDGKKIISCPWVEDPSGENRAVILKIWNALSGELITDIAESLLVSFAEFSPDGKKIISISDSVRIWDAGTGKQLTRLNETINWESKVLLSPDGKWVLATDPDKSVILFDVITGRRTYTLRNHTAVVKIMQFTPDGKNLVTVSANETITWDASSWKILRKIPGRIEGDPLFFTPNNQKIVTADFQPENKNVSIWDAASRKFVRKKKGNNSITNTEDLFQLDNGLRGSIVAATNKRYAAVINTAINNNLQISFENDKTASLWDINTGLLVDSLKGHTDGINFLEFTQDGTKLVTASDDGTAKIWDAASGKLLTDLRSHTFNSRAANFSPAGQDDHAGGNRIVTASDDGSAKIWDLAAGSLVKILKGPNSNMFSVQFSQDGNKIISGYQDGTTILWDAATGKRIELKETSPVRIDPTAEADLEAVTNLVPPELSPDGTKVITSIQSKTIKLFDASTGKLLYQLTKDNYPGIAYAYFSPDGNKIITGWKYYDHQPDRKDTNMLVWGVTDKKPLFKIEAIDAKFSSDNTKIITSSFNIPKVWNAKNGKYLFSLTCDTCNQPSWGLFSPDSKTIFTTSWFDSVGSFWKSENGKYLYALKGKRNFISAQFSPDGKKIITMSSDGGSEIWETQTGSYLNALKGHTDVINYAEFSPDSRNILTTSRDNTSKIWDASTGKLLYTFFALDSAEYFVWLPSGYYQGTPDAAKRLHYVSKDLKAISFEQQDVKYNRPDLVLEAIGNPDTALINTYRHAYHKRIKKLGIDTSSFQEGYSVPDADFVNREDIAFEQKDESLSLHIKGIDSTYPLDRYNVWVNEVPVFGQRGISIRKNNSNNFHKILAVNLSPGENRIETSVTNANGAESYRMPLIVNYTPAVNQKEKTYFIGIGIDKFADSAYNLSYSSKDIRDLSAKLKQKYGNDISMDTLFNENVTGSNIKALKQKLLQTTVNDRVIISYSGHGLLSKSYDYYLSTYSVNFKTPEENGLPYEEFENLLDSIPARKKLMLIDACHSGEVDKEEFQQVKINKAVLDANHIVSKGAEISNTDDSGTKKLGLKNSFELMQNLFVNVGKSTGATIISAAAGTEFALENGNLKNGVFTYCLLEALDKYPTMKISELKKRVGARVEELTSGMQKPTSRNEAIAVDWKLW